MKPELVFALENASWPVLLMDPEGTIRKASRGAIALFGTGIGSGSTLLGTLWGNGNDALSEFLAKLDRLVQSVSSTRLNFRVKGGAQTPFQTFICVSLREGQKQYVLQLFPDTPAEAKPAPPEPRPATPAPPSDPSAYVLDAGPAEPSPELKAQQAEALLQKHKLDCALQLTRTVALDFNNALTSILGHTSLILQEMPPDHAWRTSLVEAEKAAEKAAEIAHDLAAFSRQEKDHRPQQAGNLNALLRRTAEFFQKPGSRVEGLEWQLDLDSRLYAVHFDEAKMQQAFIKIIENSVQSLQDMVKQGFMGHIQVTCRNLDLSEPTHDQNAHLLAGSYVVTEIIDNGPGISPEALPRVFEPFFTTKVSHRGLGLAWVYGVVTNHGGSVSISSEQGRGTSVRVYLPATRKFVRNTVHKKEDLRGGETILMVDDEDLLLTMGHMVLSSFGYKVLTANSGEKALAILSSGKHNVDLLITDLVMPQMSGRELVEHVRRLNPQIKILYSSGYVRPSRDEEDDYLQKPFTSQGLVSKVKQALSAA